MSEWVGMIIGCDRCGKEIRMKRLGERELDGGFTYNEKFEELPKTWKYHYETGYLCPECSSEYELLLQNFKLGSPRLAKED